jgi:hypothetical protein
MRPATAARIEWRRQPSGTGTITARRPTTGVVLWTSRPFDARSGKETFPALEGALREAASRGECPVSVELQLGGARRSTVSFTIVGRDAEARIDRRLKEIGAVVAGDVRGLLSGGILEQQGLLREALDEYAAVWRRSPSEFLRSKVQALAEVLNDPRLGEFEGRTNGPVARE